MHKAVITAVAAILACGSSALAWDAHGHRTIAWLAMDAMAAKVPDEAKKAELAFVFAESGRAQVGYQSGEPDRYRAINLGQLKHENEPDHYIDIEQLDQFGLTLSTVAPLRNEFLRAMVIAKHEHPDNVEPYNERRDPARTKFVENARWTIGNVVFATVHVVGSSSGSQQQQQEVIAAAEWERSVRWWSRLPAMRLRRPTSSFGCRWPLWTTASRSARRAPPRRS